MPRDDLVVSSLLDLTYTLAARLLESVRYPWQALETLSSFILSLGPELPRELYEERAPGIWIARDATIADSASISGPCIIDSGATIRHCAFIRGSVIVGKGAVVGNSTEVKNAILFDRAQAPHFNYIGDSILGYRAHIGAGVITSNLRSDKKPVVIHTPEENIITGAKKLGAILGDDVEIGCNSVLCPGSIVGRGSIVYPTACVRKTIPARHILKLDGSLVSIRSKEENDPR